MASASSDLDDLSLSLRDDFLIPSNADIGASSVHQALADKRCTYLCGNSLGPLPNRSEKLVQEELKTWATRAVKGHFDHPHDREWMHIADTVTPYLAELIGADEKEVACMGTLTANLHLMLASFYKPTAQRYKIICEAKAFPSDQYAFASQAILHGYDPKDAIIEMFPRKGEYTLRESDILHVIAQEGPSIALVMFSGVQFYTGQWFPMQAITRAAKEQGCICGWDLAHAIGNVPMSLHSWDVDFAVWCSYKYLNSGPGGIGGLFVHNKWDGSMQPQYAGWWGHDPTTRFSMPPTFSAIPGAQGYQQSNPSVLATVSLLGALQMFKEVGMMQPLRERSIRLTEYLYTRLSQSTYFVPPEEVLSKYPSTTTEVTPAGDASDGGDKSVVQNFGFTIITPREPESRGAQLSLLFLPTGSDIMRRIFNCLSRDGVIGDERKPDVIRLAPAPLYTTLEDCERAVESLEKAFKSLA